MKLSELQEKDIVNINNGRKIGKIIDAEINMDGLINYLIVEDNKMFRRLTNKDSISITFNQIKKIGEDCILIDI